MAIATTALIETEAERLRAKCIQALKDEHMVDVQVKALQKKIKALQRQGKKLQSDTADKAAETEDAILEYAKATCREFCNQVYKTFPREVRDIIYGYVADCDKVRVNEGPCEENQEIFYLNKPSGTLLQYAWGRIEPWWDPDFAGSDMVREIGENVYRTACFDFGHRFHLIPKFRVTDQWRLGFSPVSFVSNVEVLIPCDDYQLGPWHGEVKDLNDYVRNPVPATWGYENPQKIPSDILVELESLFGFKSGTSITIEMELDRYGEYKAIEKEEWMCENIVPLIFPTVQRLNLAGYRVRFIIFGDRYSDPPHSFESDWDPISAEYVSDSFGKHVELQQKALQQALDDAEVDEEISQGTVTPRDNEVPAW